MHMPGTHVQPSALETYGPVSCDGVWRISSCRLCTLLLCNLPTEHICSCPRHAQFSSGIISTPGTFITVLQATQVCQINVQGTQETSYRLYRACAPAQSRIRFEPSTLLERACEDTCSSLHRVNHSSGRWMRSRTSAVCWQRWRGNTSGAGVHSPMKYLAFCERVGTKLLVLYLRYYQEL